jgi:hypothetical protein
VRESGRLHTRDHAGKCATLPRSGKSGGGARLQPAFGSVDHIRQTRAEAPRYLFNLSNRSPAACSVAVFFGEVEADVAVLAGAKKTRAGTGATPISRVIQCAHAA